MRKNFFFIIIVLSVLVSSCVEPPVAEWEINKERILAVKSYPAQTTTNAVLEALAFGPNGPAEPFDIFWRGSSINDVSDYSKNRDTAKTSGTIIPPIGNRVTYQLPETEGTYWAITILKDNPHVITLKEVYKVTEVTNRNPKLSDLIFDKRFFPGNDTEKEINVSVNFNDPDNDKLLFSWFVTAGSLNGCNTNKEIWKIKKSAGYNEIFVVARDGKGGIDWKVGEIYVGDYQDKNWVESGGILYPTDLSLSTYPDTFTYEVTVVKDSSSDRGFKIDFGNRVTESVDAITLDKVFLNFESCSLCKMIFHKVK